MTSADRKGPKPASMEVDADAEGTGPSARPEELANTGDVAAFPVEAQHEDALAEGERTQA